MKFLSTAAFFVIALSLLATSAFAQSPSREQVLNEIQAKRADLQTLEKEFLSVPDEDRAPHSDFLAKPDTGIVRLLPREVYDIAPGGKSLKRLTIRGGGAYYSFTRLTHEYGYGSDIELSSGYLSVGFAGLDYGMLLKVGDVPLENISFESPGMQFISAYSPPASEPEIRQEQRRFSDGATVNELVYKNRVPLETNTTFLLRSINFETTDVLITFKVIRKDTDGSVILLWKLLKKYPTPALASNKVEVR